MSGYVRNSQARHDLSAQGRANPTYAPPPVALRNNPKFRALAWQLGLLALVLWFGWQFALNARANMQAQQITGGFGFLASTAGFGVNQSLISYSESDSYGRVFLVGLLNTLLVAVIGIVLATIIGFLIGIARLSSNWLLARLAGGFQAPLTKAAGLFQAFTRNMAYGLKAYIDQRVEAGEVPAAPAEASETDSESEASTEGAS